jgi:hypothetical protein
MMLSTFVELSLALVLEVNRSGSCINRRPCCQWIVFAEWSDRLFGKNSISDYLLDLQIGPLTMRRKKLLGPLYPPSTSAGNISMFYPVKALAYMSQLRLDINVLKHAPFGKPVDHSPYFFS